MSNSSMILPQDCNLDICDLEINPSAYEYRPNLTMNVILCALFGLSLIAHIIQGIRYRTWTFLIAMGFGGFGEIVGYVGRIMSWNNPWNGDAFLTQIVCLTIAPAFFAAGIYLCLSRIVTIFGARISRIPPVYYTRLFIGCDIISLILQAAGGGIASSAEEGDQEGQDLGTNVMLGGVAFQVFTLSMFMALCAEFAVRVMRKSGELDMNFATVRESRRFRIFLYVLATSTITIMIRSVFRLIEMAQGWNGELAGNETMFFVLEGVMVIVAVGVLNIWHPGMAMREAYHVAKGKGMESSVELKSSTTSVI